MSKWKAILIAVIIAAPCVASAANGAINLNTNIWSPAILKGPLVVCTGAIFGNSEALPQCNNICDIVAQFIQIVYFMMGVAIWVILPIYFAIAGITFMASQGNEKRTHAARARLTEAVWGLLIMLCAWVAVATFVKALSLSNYVTGFGTSGACVVQQSSPATSLDPNCGGGCSGTQICVPYGVNGNGSTTYACQ